MAKASVVEIVLVIDTSDSMRPCIDHLRKHLQSLIKPLQGYAMKVRFGLVGLSAAKGPSGILYRTKTLGPDLSKLYGRHKADDFFTDSADTVISRLDSFYVSGDEDTPLALDIALDHPFGPVATTRRVVAVFTDEPIENGVRKRDALDELPQLVEKIHARRIKLFMAAPYSDGIQKLSEADGSEIEDIGDSKGLASVDFSRLLDQMGKSISVMSAQSGETDYRRALFGQDQWVNISGGWDERDR